MSIASLCYRVGGGLVGPPRTTQNAGTVIAAPIIPWGGELGTGTIAQLLTHLTTLCYTTSGATAHQIFVMRPFNYTFFSADAAASQAVVNIAADPGLYATAANWNYRPFPNGTPSVANNAIAAGDYVMYQRADGTWALDTVASVATLAITLTTSLATGGVKQGGLFYFFGVVTDSDPNTGQLNPSTQIAASQTRDKTWSDTTAGVVASLHKGDPMIFYSANASNAGILEFIAGFYAEL